MKFGYIRVSTTSQNIDRQTAALSEAGCEKIFVDKLSGRDTNRPELQKMFEQFRPGDVLVITELARFGRSLSDLIDLSNRLSDLGVDLLSLKEPAINTTAGNPFGRLFFHIMGSIYEFQRDITNELTSEGLKAARAKGNIGGRPKVDSGKLQLAMTLYRSKEYSVKEVCEKSGVSKASLYKYLKISKQQESEKGA